MKAVILAGGLGTRLSEETYLKPKPMVEIGGRPILWHVMKIYSAYGINDFVICVGYKGYVIKEYFANYFLHMSDVTFDIRANSMEVHQRHAEPWKVTIVDTGEETLTGGRLKQVLPYADGEDFCFDQIVAFAEVEQFVDTPVKRYSSGMYVRLAFSVAAHLQPDILIVDEVLAVGDAAFQKKCLGRMDEAAFKEGRTILFVSHNMTSVRNLCTRAVLIKQGNLAANGPAADIVDQYLEEGAANTGKISAAGRAGSGRLRVTAVDFESPNGGRIEELPAGQPVVVRIRHTADGLKPSDSVVAGLGVVGAEDALFNNYSNFSGQVFKNLPRTGALVFEWPSVDLVPGPYHMVPTATTMSGKSLICHRPSHSMLPPPIFMALEKILAWDSASCLCGENGI